MWTLGKTSQVVQKPWEWVKNDRIVIIFGEVSLALYFLLCNQWSLPHTKGQVTLSANPLCHQQVVFITVKGSRSSVLACQGFQLAFCVEFIPLLLTAALIAAWGTMTQTCTHAAAYWPTTLSVENQSRNKKQRERGGREGKRKMPVSWTGFEKAPPPPPPTSVVILVTSFRSDAGEHGFCLCCTVLSESKHTTVFSLPFSQNKQHCCVILLNVSRTDA